MMLWHIILIGIQTGIIVVTLIFTRKDRREDMVKKYVNEVKHEFKGDINLIFSKLNDLVSNDLCLERMRRVEKDVDNIGNMVRGGQ